MLGHASNNNSLVSPQSGKQHELPVALQVSTEPECCSDAKLFHDDEAKRIAEGIPLVGVAPEQVDGSRFIERTHALKLAEPVLNIVEKAHGDLAAIARANPNQRVGFSHNGVRRDQDSWNERA
jgi:hypothetical protein